MSDEVLRRVAIGETFEVIDNGRVIAHVSPAFRTSLDDLEVRGELRAATGDLSALQAMTRKTPMVGSMEILEDTRRAD